MSQERSQIRPGASVAAAVAGLLAAWSIPGHPPGLNFVLTGLAVAAAALLARPCRVWWPAAATSLLLVAFFAVRSAGWLLTIDLLTATGLAAVALVDARTWRALAALPLSLARAVLRGPVAVAAPLAARLRSWIPPAARPFVRGLVIAAGMVSVFGGLFFSADAAFAHLTAEALVPGWNVTLLPARAIVLVGAFALAASFVVLPARAGSEGPFPWRSDGRRLQRVEWAVALGALDLLFVAFVVVQITVLFGGRTHVLTTTGVTYAEYARQGFFQLLAVAALVLGVIAWTVSRVDASQARERLWLRVLLGVLCVSTLIVLASALRRLDLYEEAYGFTRLRISVHAAIVWIGVAFTLLLGAGALWRAVWLPRAFVVVTGAGLIAFNLIDPDATIARQNIARFERGRQIDTAYLATLSPDALPALMELPEETRVCPMAVIAARLARDDSPFAFNVSRDAAERIAARENLARGGEPWPCFP